MSPGEDGQGAWPGYCHHGGGHGPQEGGSPVCAEVPEMWPPPPSPTGLCASPMQLPSFASPRGPSPGKGDPSFLSPVTSGLPQPGPRSLSSPVPRLIRTSLKTALSPASEEGALRPGAWGRHTRLSAPTGLQRWSPAPHGGGGLLLLLVSGPPGGPTAVSTVVAGQEGGGATALVQADPTPGLWVSPGLHGALQKAISARARPRVLLTSSGSCAMLLHISPGAGGAEAP